MSFVQVPSMSVQDKNKAVVAKYFEEYWSKLNEDIVDELCADDFMISYPMHGPKYGKQAAKDMLKDFKAVSQSLHHIFLNLKHSINFIQAFPDLCFKSYGDYGLIADGDFVAGRWIGGGTHAGTTFDDLVVGGLDRENTGRKMRFSGITIFTLKDGKIVKEVGEEGGMGALHQLGILPGPNNGKKYMYDEA